jgi:hypothetical protein
MAQKTLRSAFASFLATASATLALVSGVQGAESASGAYLLGLRGQGAGMTPPAGVYFSNQLYFYSATAGGNISLGGTAFGVNVEANPIVNIPTALFVTDQQIFGGRLGFSATVPFGLMDITASIGGIGSVNDKLTTFADPSLGAFLGWNSGNFHWQTGITSFLPIGDYHPGAISNVAKHRLALDVYGALTWFEPELGIDFSNIVGVTFNTTNKETNYKTGTEFHWEGSLTKKFTPSFSAGVIGYYYRQLTDDTGNGATLGAFRGEIAAVGLTAGYDFKLGQIPVSSKVRYYHEFGAVNRLEGDAVYLSLSLPLWVPSAKN